MKKKKFLIVGGICALFSLTSFLSSCGTKDSGRDSNGNSENAVENEDKRPLNLSIFVDLSDRIQKNKDEMDQADKDTAIINGLASSFFDKQQGTFSKSEDSFQVVFYPAPKGSQNLAENLAIDLSSIVGPKKKPLLEFNNHHSENIKQLYDSALNAPNFFGSDIWGYFNKDKVKDLYKKGCRNVLIILSDGYVYDENNKIHDGKNYSYILRETLAVPGSGLIPCKISNPDFEVYFMECNPNPATDFDKMKNVLESWFKDMGIKSIDIQDTDIPANTLKHLRNAIF